MCSIMLRAPAAGEVGIGRRWEGRGIFDGEGCIRSFYTVVISVIVAARLSVVIGESTSVPFECQYYAVFFLS